MEIVDKPQMSYHSSSWFGGRGILNIKKPNSI